MSKIKIKKLAENRPFVCYFFFVGWGAISLGLHIGLMEKNIEIHLPFGFIRIGYESIYEIYEQGENNKT